MVKKKKIPAMLKADCRRKLTMADENKIRNALVSGILPGVLAKQFDVSYATIRRIGKRR